MEDTLQMSRIEKSTLKAKVPTLHKGMNELFPFSVGNSVVTTSAKDDNRHS